MNSYDLSLVKTYFSSQEALDNLSESIAYMVFEAILDLPSAIEKRDWKSIRAIGEKLVHISNLPVIRSMTTISELIIGKPSAVVNVDFVRASDCGFLDRSVVRAKRLIEDLQNNILLSLQGNETAVHIYNVLSSFNVSALCLASGIYTYASTKDDIPYVACWEFKGGGDLNFYS
jgi:hypothetical protein